MAAATARSQTASSALTSMRRAWNVRSGNGGLDHPDQPGRGGERLLLALANDGGGDASGEAFLAVGLEDAGELAVRVRVEHLGRGDAGRLVHPHVERRVVAVGEAALRFVELERGDAEVEQDAVCDTVGVLGDDVGDLVVDGVDTEEAVTEAGQPTPITRAAGHRSRIASAWPPIPSVPSMHTAPCADSAGARRSTMRSRSTGTCRSAASPALLIVVLRVGGAGVVVVVGWWVVVLVDPAAGPHPIRARHGGSRVGIGSAGGRRSGRCALRVRVRGPPPRSRPSTSSRPA